MAVNFSPHLIRAAQSKLERTLQALKRRGLELVDQSKRLMEESQRLMQVSSEIRAAQTVLRK